MHAVALHLQQKQVKGVEVVQLKGGVSHSHVNTYAVETVNLFAEAFHTIARYLPLPVIFDSHAVKKMVEEDRHIQRIIELGKQANIAVFTVGTVKEDALLFRLGYFNGEEQKLLQRIGKGDICSRFLTLRATYAVRKSIAVPSGLICLICERRRSPFSSLEASAKWRPFGHRCVASMRIFW